MTNNAYDENKLLTACLNGDTTAFEIIVHKYKSLVCAITYSAVGQMEESEELAQQTFVNAWKNLKQLKDFNKFKAWLLSITRNVIRDSFKKHNHDVVSKATPIDNLEEIEAQTPDPSHNLISKEQQAIVFHALQAIPESYRQPLVLFYRQEQSVSQVAEQLDLSEDAVRTRLSRGRKMLKEQVAAMVETTLSSTAPGKIFTIAVMASVAGIALKGAGVAAAETVSAASTNSAASTATSILGTLTGKVITAAVIAVIAVSSVIIYKNATQTDNANTTAQTIPSQPKPKIEKPTDTVAPAAITSTTSLEQIVKQPETVESPEQIAASQPMEPEAISAKKEENTITYKGIVTDELGNPVGNVHVWSHSYTYGIQFSGIEADTTTDDKGNFTIGPVIAGSEENVLQRYIIFEHLDYAIGWVDPSDLKKMAEQKDPIIQTTLHAPSLIAGSVTDSDGNPITDAVVEIHLQCINEKQYDYFFMRKLNDMAQFTDDNGLFIFERLPKNARISLTISHKDYAFYSTEFAYPDRDEYVIKTDDQDIQITMEPGGSIKGRFIYEDGKPFKGEKVLLYIANSTGMLTLAQTDLDGRFQTCALPDNTYMVKPLTGSFIKQKLFCRTLTDVNVSLDTGATEIDMIVQKPLPVTVTIFDSQSGLPLQNISVSAILNHIYELKGSVPEASARTDEQGKCILAVAPDKYQITARGHKNNAFHDFTKELVVTADSKDLSVEIEITPPDVVWGTLYDSQGNPLQGTVSLASQKEKTDTSGNFELSLEWARDMEVYIGFARDETKELSTVFSWNKLDNIYDLQLTLDKPATITGKMTDPDGNPITDAKIKLYIKTGNGGSRGLGKHQWLQKIDPDGSFVITNIPTGLQYHVFAERPGWQGSHDVLDIKPDQKVNIGNLTLKPLMGFEGDVDWTGVLNGTVIDEFGKPVPGLKVHASIGTVQFDDKTDRRGRFTLRKLPKGKNITCDVYLAGYGHQLAKATIDGTHLEIQMFPQGWDIIGKPAPELHVKKWMNLDEDITMENYKGYVTLIQVGVMVRSYGDDLKLTRKMLDKYHDKGFEVIAIHHSLPIGWGAKITEQNILDYIDNTGIDYPVGIDAKDGSGNGSMYSQYKVQATPAFYLIDKKGLLRISPKRSELEDWIKRLLKE